MIRIILAVFLTLFVLREIAAWNMRRQLKYFFTPLITMTVVLLPVISIERNGITYYNLFILIALLLALAADTLLMIEEVSLLKSGMIFFLGGHICFAAAFSANFSFKSWNLILLAILTVINYFNINRIRINAGKLFPAVMIYTLSINVMIYLAITGLNSGFTKHAVCTATGAVLFAISDYILSRNTFVRQIPHSTVYTWLFYAPAQFLIALSTL